MKKLILILAVICSGGWAMAQEAGAGVPEAVKRTFDSLYPKTEGVSWNMRHGNYEANFSGDNRAIVVEIDPKGALVETEAETPVASLPTEIPMYVIKFYPGVKISKAYVVTASNGKMTYRTEVGEVDLLFDNQGKFMSSEERDITPVQGGDRNIGASPNDKK